MPNRFYKKHQKTIDKFDGLLLNNTVLERGLVVAPVIVITTSLLNAKIIGIAFVLITFMTVVFSSFIPKKVPYTVRVIAYVLIASIIFVPVAKMLDMMYPETLFKLGIFLPLLVTNSLIVTKTETRFFRVDRKTMLADLFCHVMGFFVVIILVGFIREFLGQGIVMGEVIEWFKPMKVFSLPFGGFIVVGFLAALMQRISNNVYGKSVKKSVKERR